MKRNYYIIILFAIQAFLLSCGEEPVFREPLEHSSAVPANVNEVTYQGLAGAVKLIYNLPNDPNVSQVMATYTLTTGKERTISASVYTDYMILDGFADEEEHEIEVFTVSKSGVKSTSSFHPVVPKEAAIWKVQKSIEFTNQFGGFNVEGVNSDTAAITIYIMERNSFNEFEVNNFKSFATTFQNITRKIRGLDTLTYEYKYFVMDKWDNSTDTTLVHVDPLYETGIPKAGYKNYKLPGDAPQVTNGATIEGAWDDRHFWPYCSFTSQELGGKNPHVITIDMGMEAQLSRFWYRPYPEFWWDPSLIQYFYLTAMREFEIYGSTAPNTNGKLDSTWVLMGHYEIEKPSGSAYGNDTPEDVAYAEAGINFEFDVTLPRVRYIRIRCLRNWADGTAQNIDELEFFGDPRPN